jgi:hypothetical protein
MEKWRNGGSYLSISGDTNHEHGTTYFVRSTGPHHFCLTEDAGKQIEYQGSGNKDRSYLSISGDTNHEHGKGQSI